MEKTRVPESGSKLNEQDVAQDALPLQMIFHVDISEKRKKNVDYEKKKEKTSPSDKDTFVHEHFDKPIDSLKSINEGNKSNTSPTENVVVEPTETTRNPYVEPSGKTSIETPTEPASEPISEPSVETPTKSNDENHDEANLVTIL